MQPAEKDLMFNRSWSELWWIERCKSFASNLWVGGITGWIVRLKFVNRRNKGINRYGQIVRSNCAAIKSWIQSTMISIEKVQLLASLNPILVFQFVFDWKKLNMLKWMFSHLLWTFRFLPQEIQRSLLSRLTRFHVAVFENSKIKFSESWSWIVITTTVGWTIDQSIKKHP
jgi:hypothetical protein